MSKQVNFRVADKIYKQWRALAGERSLGEFITSVMTEKFGAPQGDEPAAEPEPPIERAVHITLPPATPETDPARWRAENKVEIIAAARRTGVFADVSDAPVAYHDDRSWCPYHPDVIQVLGRVTCQTCGSHLYWPRKTHPTQSKPPDVSDEVWAEMSGRMDGRDPRAIRIACRRVQAEVAAGTFADLRSAADAWGTDAWTTQA